MDLSVYVSEIETRVHSNLGVEYDCTVTRYSNGSASISWSVRAVDGKPYRSAQWRGMRLQGDPEARA